MLNHFSHVQLFVILWNVACQAHLPMRFSRQEYWDICHALLQGIFSTQGLNLRFLAGRFFTPGTTWGAQAHSIQYNT